jgi:cytochrome c553
MAPPADAALLRPPETSGIAKPKSRMMKRALRILGWLFTALAGVAVLGVAYLYIASEVVIARKYDIPLTKFRAPADEEAIRRGERVATIVGCNNCHGPELAGSVMFDQPGVARVHAPNLTRLLQQYTDAELERLLRHGVKRDGRSTWIMPSYMFSHLTDEDLAAVVAYVRSKPERDGVDTGVSIQALGRVGVLLGTFKPEAAEIAEHASRQIPDLNDPVSHGRYLVMNACTECHGRKLEGWQYIKSPSLAIVAGYTEADLARLLRTGVALGDRKLGLMSKIAPNRFSTLSDGEVRAIHTYLNAFAQRGSLP